MLRQANCVKHCATAEKFSLQADAGESFLVKCVYLGPTDSSGYPVFRVDRKTVGAYRGGAQGASHLGHMDDTFIPMNLMKWLGEKDINVFIPVAEGQTFTVTRAADAGEVTVVYDMYDAGDIRADMPNGTDSKEFTFLQYMTASAALESVGDHLLNVSLSPAEFPNFPCGDVVPARMKMDILGLVGIPVSKGDGTSGFTSTEYVKLIKDREVLFDEDRDGIPFFATDETGTTAKYQIDFSLIGDCVSIGATLAGPSYGLPLLFDPPLHFESGEELLVYLTCDFLTAGTIAVTEVRLAAIIKALIG